MKAVAAGVGRKVYEAHLRQAVRERLPWAEWGQVKNGIAELVQVPVGVREEFSQRRQRILEREAELEAAGVSVGHKGRERIVFDTREAKKEIDEQRLARAGGGQSAGARPRRRRARGARRSPPCPARAAGIG